MSNSEEQVEILRTTETYPNPIDAKIVSALQSTRSPIPSDPAKPPHHQTVAE